MADRSPGIPTAYKTENVLTTNFLFLKFCRACGKNNGAA